MKKKILTGIFAVLCVIGAFCAIYFPTSNISNEISDVQNVILEEIQTSEVVVSEETEELVIQTKEAIESGDDLSTTEEIENADEESLEEEYLELDAQVEQENISYDGTATGDGLSLLGAYQGLTYYSQADSRWANVMYSSINDSSQTMKSSGCGVTSGAMVVSSSKGAILPTTMAQLAVDNGYRTASNGTAWAYFSFIADYFDFDEFYTTYNFNTMTSYLKQKNSDGSSKYYVVASCGSGLFTTGGHYIVLVADTDSTITVYDPYLYSGKFSTASRKSAGVIVSGNSAYVTESAFKTYANYKCFWVFSNDQGSGNTTSTSSTTTSSSTSSSSSSTSSNSTVKSVSYTRYVATQSNNLNVRSGAGTSYSITSSLARGTAVKVTKVDGNWSYITSPVKGWVSSSYLSSTKVVTTYTRYVNTTKNNLLVRKTAKSNGTIVTSLVRGTTVTVTKTSGSWSYITSPATGWVSTSYLSSTKPSSYSTTVGKTYTLKSRTTLYSKGNLTGTKYTYLSGTKVKVIKHYSTTVDYVYISATKRYAYVKVSAFK